jgi:hypothetical protein
VSRVTAGHGIEAAIAYFQRAEQIYSDYDRKSMIWDG